MKDGTFRFDVTVHDGRRKEDKELEVAVVKCAKKVACLDDDGDSGSTSWKGGPVITLAEATSNMRTYCDE